MGKVWEYDDGGRKRAGFKGTTGDCVVRAIAIAAELPYQQVYDELFAASREFAETRNCRTARFLRGKGRCSPRTGVPMKVIKLYLAKRGFKWVATA